MHEGGLLLLVQDGTAVITATPSPQPLPPTRSAIRLNIKIMILRTCFM